MNISVNSLKEFSSEFNNNKIYGISKNAITNTSLNKILLNSNYIQQKHNDIFEKKIPIELTITDQENSGRCWIFAYLNVLRLKIVKRYNLPNDFEFSQTYLFFYDQLEKSNLFLKHIIDTRKKDLNSRIIIHLLSQPISDGGQYNMLINLINKYGLIPKTSMRETFQSNNTNKFSKILNNKLREHAKIIREMSDSEFKNINTYVKNVMSEIYRLCVIFLGEPPHRITWEYYTKKNRKSSKKGKHISKKRHKKRKKTQKGGSLKQYKINKNITPIEFYKKYVKYDLNNVICLINNPIRPYYKLYNATFFNNMVDGVDTNYVNIPIDIMKTITRKSLDSNEAVWFSCDVSKFSSSSQGILDQKAFNYKDTLGIDIMTNKKEQLNYFISEINHAMVFKGYTKDKDSKDTTIKKWLVENSWGSNSGLHGNLIMSDQWFDDYVFEIVVDKRFCPKNITNILKSKAILLDPWDPFGNLLIK